MATLSAARAVLAGRLAALDRGRLVKVGLIVGLAELSWYNGFQLVSWIPRSLAQNDFRLYYGAARVGLTSGWSHIYDATLQRAAAPAGWPGVAEWFPYLNPPPLAWLIAPLTLLPAPVAYVPWVVAIAAGLLGAAWLLAPAGALWKVVFAGSALGFLPTFVAVAYGQPAPLIGFAIAAACLLLEGKRQLAAGLVVSVLALKPQVAVLVPLALLAGRYWRAVTAWGIATGALALLSLASLGERGIGDYGSLAARYVGDPYFERWSLIPWVGSGWGWYAGVAAVVVVTAVAAARFRDRPGAVLAIGVLGSLLVNHYLTPADFTILLLTIWLLVRDRPPAWFLAWLGVLWMAGWFSLADGPEVVAAELATLLLLASGLVTARRISAPLAVAAQPTGGDS